MQVHGMYWMCAFVSSNLSSTALTVAVTSSGSTTAGSTDYSITCTVTLTGLTGTPTIEWMDPVAMVISTDTDFTLGPVTGSGTTYSRELMFKSLKTSLAGEYTCNASLGSQSETATTSVTVTSMCLTLCCSTWRRKYHLPHSIMQWVGVLWLLILVAKMHIGEYNPGFSDLRPLLHAPKRFGYMPSVTPQGMNTEVNVHITI